MEPTPESYAALEAALFAYGEPMPRETLANVLEVDAAALDGMLRTYKEVLDGDTRRGLTLLDQGKTVQLVTKPEVGSIVSALFKAEVSEELTQAALETLALIAYFGPIPRAKLEYVRGVNSAFTLRNLLVRGLIERVPEGNRANMYQYQASADLLRFLGVRGKEELPDFGSLQKLLEESERQAAAQAEAAASPTEEHTVAAE